MANTLLLSFRKIALLVYSDLDSPNFPMFLSMYVLGMIYVCWLLGYI